jgi:hypothetical protein
MGNTKYSRGKKTNGSISIYTWQTVIKVGMAAMSSLRFAILQDLKLRLNLNSPVHYSQEEDATVTSFKTW